MYTRPVVPTVGFTINLLAPQTIRFTGAVSALPRSDRYNVSSGYYDSCVHKSTQMIHCLAPQLDDADIRTLIINPSVRASGCLKFRHSTLLVQSRLAALICRMDLQSL
jgi:hypothetical protein